MQSDEGINEKIIARKIFLLAFPGSSGLSHTLSLQAFVRGSSAQLIWLSKRPLQRIDISDIIILICDSNRVQLHGSIDALGALKSSSSVVMSSRQ